MKFLDWYGSLDTWNRFGLAFVGAVIIIGLIFWAVS